MMENNKWVNDVVTNLALTHRLLNGNDSKNTENLRSHLCSCLLEAPVHWCPEVFVPREVEHAIAKAEERFLNGHR